MRTCMMCRTSFEVFALPRCPVPPATENRSDIHHELTKHARRGSWVGQIWDLHTSERKATQSPAFTMSGWSGTPCRWSSSFARSGLRPATCEPRMNRVGPRSQRRSSR